MLIGIDLDNTIVCYDKVFERLASEQKLPGNVTSAGKLAIRDYLRQQDREDEWTVMQGRAYGSRMTEAVPFQGVVEFMERARDRAHEICIVSHRTKQPFLGDPVDLHAAAREWLRERGIDQFASVFLEETAAEKAAQINALGCDVFIDDLPEFLGRSDFPDKTRKLHFTPSGAGESDGAKKVVAWEDIARLLLHQ